MVYRTLTRSLQSASLRSRLSLVGSAARCLSPLSHRPFHHSASRFKVQPYLLADIGEGITECRLVEWFVKPGDRVNQFDAICEVQSDKASVEITSRYDGTIKDLHYQVDDMAIVGKAILDIDVEDNDEMETANNDKAPLDERQLVPLTPNEAQMFKVMTESLKIPHFGFTHAIDVTELGLLRRKVNEDLAQTAGERRGEKSALTSLAFICKAISRTFEQYPKLNAHLDTETAPENPQLVMQEAHNFGIAVDTPKGLLVPVVRNVQKHSIFSLAAEINRLAALAREGRLAPDDMQGATFTVSNVGSIGGAAVSPIIVQPMTAIVAIGRIEDVASFSSGEDGEEKVIKRQKVVLSWSADHRVHDGATIGRCAEAVKEKLQSSGELETMLQ